ncbi:MAG: glycosyltransferase 87 family protein [Ignisphaera sp.]|nr:glycosyltransferase 87 family protein [Ignisphaera sp.]MCX8167714.1 glycosyltransferase 87 family protein [Ignisphaera sp.]MDW8085278.1 glycosyltransferase 87 family protein [Ignisphaera sp.]
MRGVDFKDLLFIAVLAVGLLIRLVLAPYSSGSDVVQFAGFAKTFHRHGFCFYRYASAHSSESWPFNWPYLYGPVLMYLLGALAHIVPPIYDILWQGDSYSIYVSTNWVFALKFIYILFDVAITIAIYLITRSVYASTIFYLNPATIYISSIYGMFDQMAAAVIIIGIYMLSRKRFWLSGIVLGISLMIKQTMLFPIVGLGISLLLRNKAKNLFIAITGFTMGILAMLAPILLFCPSSLQGIFGTLYMVKPRYAEPIMYNFNGVTGIATLIHRFNTCGEFCGYEILWSIEHWYLFTAILSPFVAVSTLVIRDLYKLSTLYYILFTATYWGVNYQYLVPEIAFIAIASAYEKDRWLKALYIAASIYIALWVFIYPAEWWFRAHIHNPNAALAEIMGRASLNVYCDNIYAIYSLILTQLHYAIILRTSIHSITNARLCFSKLIRFSASKFSATVIE